MTKVYKSPHHRLSQFGWYAVQTASGQEDTVRHYIVGSLEAKGMGQYIEKVLVPAEMVSDIKRGKKTITSRKLYPGYIFIYMLLYDQSGKILQEPWDFLKSIPGLGSILGGANPLPLSEDESERIIEQVKNSQGKEIPKVQYAEGDEVKIVDGPFGDLVGVINKVETERGKVKVSLSIFGRSTLLEFDLSQIQKNIT